MPGPARAVHDKDRVIGLARLRIPMRLPDRGAMELESG